MTGSDGRVMISEQEKGPVVHDQVLVEAQIDDRIVGFRAVVVNVQHSSLWLGLVRPDPLLERLQPDQPLQLTFRRDNAAVVADSGFVSHLGSSRSRLFSVEKPSLLQMVQRRAHIRLDVERIVQFRVVSQGPSGSAGREGRGKSVNIGAGGLLFVTTTPLSVRDELELAIVLGPNDVVPAEAQVVRVERRSAEPEDEELLALPWAKPPELAVAARFLAISAVGEDRIVRHIFSVQRQRRDARKLA